jgi:ATP-dependent DNA helicase RecQ
MTDDGTAGTGGTAHGAGGTTAGTAGTTAGQTRQRAEQLLRALAGAQASLRTDQWRAIDALVSGRRRVLLVQRTGWGKSAVYFLATALLRERGAGPTVIVSPLLALMRNQAAAAAALGIRAGEIHSANVTDWDDVYAALRAGEIDVLLIGPERLNNPTFRDDYLPELAATTGLLVVDEAHCISDWGHDFRPDYRRLRTVIAGLRGGVPVLATTATANSRVVADVAEQLGIGAAAPPAGAPPAAGDAAAGDAALAHAAAGDAAAGGAALVLRGGLDRASLRLSVVGLPHEQLRYGWLVDHLAQLPGSGIVYTLTKAAAEDLAALLSAHGHAVASYHGGTESAERLAAEADLLANRVKALVATSALGMGFDKPDLGFVVHVGAPPSPVAYYQQVGRAGRAVADAEVVLLPAASDRDIWAYFADTSFPAEQTVRQTLAALAQAGRPTSTPALAAAVDLAHGRLETMLKVLDVDGAVRRVRGGWEATGAAWEYDADRYARLAQARAREQASMLDYIATRGCRMEFLRRMLDDPGATPCGRCDNCAGPRWSPAVSEQARAKAREQIDRPGVVVEPRRMWPTGMRTLGVDVSGKIPAAVGAEPGRALARLTDVGWGGRLRPLFAPGAADAPVADPLVDGVVRVLAAWGWRARPVGVVDVASRSRPALVASLAQRIAAIGRLPLLGRVERVRGGAALGRVHNSAHRLAGLWDAFALSPGLAEALGGVDGPVLLVDDLIATGWTMTVAARLLRTAGAREVLPLALAVESG